MDGAGYHFTASYKYAYHMARVLCNKQGGQAYGTMFKQIFQAAMKQFPGFKDGSNLDLIFFNSANGLKKALGTEKCGTVL